MGLGTRPGGDLCISSRLLACPHLTGEAAKWGLAGRAGGKGAQVCSTTGELLPLLPQLLLWNNCTEMDAVGWTCSVSEAV